MLVIDSVSIYIWELDAFSPTWDSQCCMRNVTEEYKPIKVTSIVLFFSVHCVAKYMYVIKTEDLIQMTGII